MFSLFLMAGEVVTFLLIFFFQI